MSSSLRINKTIGLLTLRYMRIGREAKALLSAAPDVDMS